jgi:bifunctional UDP-N-acetylglucosamine pyrophosphorylase/glucosamine-1-phosphate N-acetyltransferase
LPLPYRRRRLLLVLYGDVPLTRADRCMRLLDAGRQRGLALLTVDTLANPHATAASCACRWPKVVRIVEEKDAERCRGRSAITSKSTPASSSPLPRALARWLPDAGQSQNAQGEYYLTDIVAMRAVSESMPVADRASRR